MSGPEAQSNLRLLRDRSFYTPVKGIEAVVQKCRFVCRAETARLSGYGKATERGQYAEDAHPAVHGQTFEKHGVPFIRPERVKQSGANG
jgi:hypothetical protein